MPEQPTWEEIVAMDEATLNLAIEHLVYNRQWSSPVPESSQGAYYQLTAAGTHIIGYPRNHTASWDRTMVLAFAQRVSISSTNEPGTWICWAEGLRDGPHLYAKTEAEARLNICRLALWRAIQQQEVGHGT